MTNLTLDIRGTNQLENEDIDDISDLYMLCFHSDHSEKDNPDLKSELKFVISGYMMIWFLLREGGKLVSMASYRYTNDKDLLGDLATAPDEQGKGYMREVMKEVIYFHKQNFGSSKPLTLTVNKDKEHTQRLIKTYQRFGFELCGQDKRDFYMKLDF